MLENRRFLWISGAVLSILCLQAAGAYLLLLGEEQPVIPSVRSLPSQFGEWEQIREQTLGAEVVAYLRPDAYVDRTYFDEANGSTINLFVAYFKSLKSGYGPHSPSVCLPGAGWLTKEFAVKEVAVPGERSTIPVNRYYLEKGDQKIVVLYWYQNARRVWAEEFWAKIYLLPDLIRHRHSDVTLVRVIAPLAANESVASVDANLAKFINLSFPSVEKKLSQPDPLADLARAAY